MPANAVLAVFWHEQQGAPNSYPTILASYGGPEHFELKLGPKGRRPWWRPPPYGYPLLYAPAEPRLGLRGSQSSKSSHTTARS